MTAYTLPHVPTVDQVGVEARAAKFTKRSIKTTAKKQALENHPLNGLLVARQAAFVESGGGVHDGRDGPPR